MLKIIYIKRFNETVYHQYQQPLHALLSHVELVETESYKNEVKKIEHLLGVILSRLYLSEILNIPIKELQMGKTKQGKPFCENQPNIHFNVSHGGNYVVAAFADTPIGVDVESWKRKVPIQVAKRYYSPQEQNLLEQATNDEKQYLFFKLWTIKESYVKMLGTGLTQPLTSFEVRFEQQTPEIFKHGNKLPCTITQYEPDSEHIISACVQNATSTIQYQEITIENIIKIMEHENS